MQSESTSTYWINILEREGWFPLKVDGRDICMIDVVAENGSEFLKVAGFQLGETRFVGEKQNIFSIKVEQIPKRSHAEMLPKIQEVLPIQVQNLPIMFL